MEISLPIITPITIEIGTRNFIQENVYLSEKNNFEIIILIISHRKESVITNNCATNFSQNSWREIVGKWELTLGTCLLSEYEHRSQNAS